MYIFELHGACTAGWAFPTAEALWGYPSVQNRIGCLSVLIEDFEDFKNLLDAGERLSTEPLTMTLHKCVNCTPGGSCEPMRAVQEQAQIEREAKERQIQARLPTMYCAMPMSMQLGDINDFLEQLEKGEDDGT